MENVCEFCKAAPGMPCKTRRGEVRVNHSIRNGGVMPGRFSDGDTRVQIGVHLPTSLLKELDAKAGRLSFSRSKAVREAIMGWATA